EPIANISLGSQADVDDAVAAARRAFPSFSETTREERLALLGRIMAVYQQHYDEMAETISREMGAPIGLSKTAQAAAPMAPLATILEVRKTSQLEKETGPTPMRHEPIGVCGFITPWNWPVNQIACKVLPALAAGCAMVLKPSEIAPLNAILWAQILHEAGEPPGVFTL